MRTNHQWLKQVAGLGLILTMGVSMSACATSTFTWKEEVLLHDGKKIIVERTDIYDSSMRHEIGQGAPLAEHKTIFTIPGTDQKVIWKSDNRSFSEPEHLNLLVLDFLADTPYVATTIGGSIAYNKWGRPNPPYVFFKYLDGWKRISLEEFPEKFKINLIVTGRKKDNPKMGVLIKLADQLRDEKNYTAPMVFAAIDGIKDYDAAIEKLRELLK